MVGTNVATVTRSRAIAARTSAGVIGFAVLTVSVVVAVLVTPPTLIAWSEVDRVDVRVPGGTLEIEWNGHDAVSLTGPAVRVFESEWTR